MRLSIMPLLTVSSSQSAAHPHRHQRQVQRPHQVFSGIRSFGTMGRAQAPGPTLTIAFMTFLVLAQGGGGRFNRTWIRLTYGLAGLLARRSAGRKSGLICHPPLLLKALQARRYTLKAVHTQGGTHRRRSVATAGLMLLKGPQARR